MWCLTYVERFELIVVVDVATLTGACVIAFSHHISGVLSKSHNPLHELVNASGASKWPGMALHGDRRVPWAAKQPAVLSSRRLFPAHHQASLGHIDSAGTAWKSGAAKGRQVVLLNAVQFLLNRSGHETEEQLKLMKRAYLISAIC